MSDRMPLTKAQRVEHNRKAVANGSRKAKGRVRYAEEIGILPKLSVIVVTCFYCQLRRATQWEHRDYNKPLEVMPCCRICNQKLGPARPYDKDEYLKNNTHVRITRHE